MTENKNNSGARPLVSVIMSMRNSAATVGEAVRSIQLQTLHDWEFIVIDDGSSDNSPIIVGAIDDPRIRLVREQTSRGLATRLNQAVALSRGTFIARMDSDDISFPERLQRQVEKLQSDESIDVLGCGAVVFNDSGDLVGLLPTRTDHDTIVANPFIGFPLPHPTWCGRAVWFRANPYDGLLMKAEDQDLLLRTYRKSKFAALDEVLLGYRQDRLDLRKMLPGRRASMGSMWQYGLASGNYVAALRGILMQVVKGAIDVFVITLGFNSFAQTSRLASVPGDVGNKWRNIMRQIASRGAG